MSPFLTQSLRQPYRWLDHKPFRVFQAALVSLHCSLPEICARSAVVQVYSVQQKIGHVRRPAADRYVAGASCGENRVYYNRVSLIKYYPTEEVCLLLPQTI